MTIQQEERCAKCGHGADSHYTTGETDIDGRPVGGPYEICSECVEFDLGDSTHEFKGESA